MSKISRQIFPKLTEEALTQLSVHNILSVIEFVLESSDKLIKYTGLTYKDVCEIKKNILDNYSGHISNISTEYVENTISTGIKNFDVLLNNGLNSGYLYEICGLSSSGKTQLCQTIAVNIAIQNSKIVYYIDTKGDFCATRILEILESKQCTDEQIGFIMNQIKVSRVRNGKELLALLHHLAATLEASSSSLIIIDSLPSILYKLSKSYNTVISLNHIAGICKYLAKECKQIIITTNLVSQWNEIDGFVTDKQVNPVIKKPTLGKYWLHVPNVRLLIENLENNNRKVTLWKSTDSAIETSCTMSLSKAGFN